MAKAPDDNQLKYVMTKLAKEEAGAVYRRMYREGGGEAFDVDAAIRAGIIHETKGDAVKASELGIQFKRVLAAEKASGGPSDEAYIRACHAVYGKARLEQPAQSEKDLIPILKMILKNTENLDDGLEGKDEERVMASALDDLALMSNDAKLRIPEAEAEMEAAVKKLAEHEARKPLFAAVKPALSELDETVPVFDKLMFDLGTANGDLQLSDNELVELRKERNALTVEARDPKALADVYFGSMIDEVAIDLEAMRGFLDANSDADSIVMLDAAISYVRGAALKPPKFNADGFKWILEDKISPLVANLEANSLNSNADSDDGIDGRRSDFQSKFSKLSKTFKYLNTNLPIAEEYQDILSRQMANDKNIVHAQSRKTLAVPKFETAKAAVLGHFVKVKAALGKIQSAGLKDASSTAYADVTQFLTDLNTLEGKAGSLTFDEVAEFVEQEFKPLVASVHTNLVQAEAETDDGIKSGPGTIASCRTMISNLTKASEDDSIKRAMQSAIPGLEIHDDGTHTICGFSGDAEDLAHAGEELDDGTSWFKSKRNVPEIREGVTKLRSLLAKLKEHAFETTLRENGVDPALPFNLKISLVTASLETLRKLKSRNAEQTAKIANLDTALKQLKAVEKAASDLHKNMEPMMDHLGTAKAAGIDSDVPYGFEDRDFSATRTDLDRLVASGDRFDPNALVRLCQKFSDYFSGNASDEERDAMDATPIHDGVAALRPLIAAVESDEFKREFTASGLDFGEPMTVKLSKLKEMIERMDKDMPALALSDTEIAEKLAESRAAHVQMKCGAFEVIRSGLLASARQNLNNAKTDDERRLAQEEVARIESNKFDEARDAGGFDETAAKASLIQLHGKNRATLTSRLESLRKLVGPLEDAVDASASLRKELKTFVRGFTVDGKGRRMVRVQFGQIKALFDGIDFDDSTFDPQQVVDVYNGFGGYFDDSGRTKAMGKEFEGVKEKLDKATGLESGEAAKKVMAAILKDQLGDSLSDAERNQYATAMVVDGVGILRSRKDLLETAKSSSPEVLDTMRLITFRDRLIKFKFNGPDGKTVVEPFKGLKPDDFKNWDKIQELFKRKGSKWTLANGFYVLEAFKQFDDKGIPGKKGNVLGRFSDKHKPEEGVEAETTSQQTVEIEKYLKNEIAKLRLSKHPEFSSVPDAMKSSGFRELVEQEFEQRLEAKGAKYREYSDKFDATGKGKKALLAVKIDRQINLLNIRRKNRELSADDHREQVRALLELAEEENIKHLLKVSTNAVTSELWHSDDMMGMGDFFGGIGDAIKAKGIGLAWATVWGGLKGMWGIGDRVLGLGARMTFVLPWWIAKWGARGVGNVAARGARLFTNKVTPPEVISVVGADLKKVGEYFSGGTKKLGTDIASGSKALYENHIKSAKKEDETKKAEEKRKREAASLEAGIKELDGKTEVEAIDMEGDLTKDIEDYFDGKHAELSKINLGGNMRGSNKGRPSENMRAKRDEEDSTASRRKVA